LKGLSQHLPGGTEEKDKDPILFHVLSSLLAGYVKEWSSLEDNLPVLVL
jgi:hypothetical protein